jgi:hypothetical protein
MSLVRHYAAHPVLPQFVRRMTLHDSPVPRPAAPPAPRVITETVVRATPLTIAAPAPALRVLARSVVDRKAVVRGRALWWSGIDAATRWRRHIWKVEFLVDGAALYTDHTWPFSFHRSGGWDSRTVANGRHMLTMLGFGTHHYRLRKRIPVRVANPPMRVTISGAVSGGAVRGQVALGVASSEAVAGVALYVNGAPVSRDRSAPYRLFWNTGSVGEGQHTLTVYVRGLHGRRTAVELPVVVANAAAFPAALTSDWVAPSVAEQSGLGQVGPDR